MIESRSSKILSETISLYKFSIITKSGLTCQKVGVVGKVGVPKLLKRRSCHNVGVVRDVKMSEMAEYRTE